MGLLNTTTTVLYATVIRHKIWWRIKQGPHLTDHGISDLWFPMAAGSSYTLTHVRPVDKNYVDAAKEREIKWHQYKHPTSGDETR